MFYCSILLVVIPEKHTLLIPRGTFRHIIQLSQMWIAEKHHYKYMKWNQTSQCKTKHEYNGINAYKYSVNKIVKVAFKDTQEVLMDCLVLFFHSKQKTEIVYVVLR